jgi:hypothetical protein
MQQKPKLSALSLLKNFPQLLALLELVGFLSTVLVVALQSREKGFQPGVIEKFAQANAIPFFLNLHE